MAWTFLPRSAHFFRFKNWCKITSQKKSSLTSALCCAVLGVKLPFFQKNAFFGQKKAFFQNVHFIQKCSVIQNTVFQCLKNYFLLFPKKLIFFTILNLIILNNWTTELKTLVEKYLAKIHKVISDKIRDYTSKISDYLHKFAHLCWNLDEFLFVGPILLVWHFSLPEQFFSECFP